MRDSKSNKNRHFFFPSTLVSTLNTFTNGCVFFMWIICRKKRILTADWAWKWEHHNEEKQPFSFWIEINFSERWTTLTNHIRCAEQHIPHPQRQRPTCSFSASHPEVFNKSEARYENKHKGNIGRNITDKLCQLGSCCSVLWDEALASA